MANSFVRVPPDSSGKQIDMAQLPIGTNLVGRQRVIIADSSDPDGVVNVTNGSLNVNVESSGGIPFSAVSKSNGGALRPTPRMVDDFVQLPPDSTGKKLDTCTLTVGGNDVFRQRIVLADSNDPSGFVSVTNNALNVNIQGLGGTPLNIGTPTDGDVLTYDGATGRWVSQAPAVVTPPPTYYFSDAEVLGGSGTSWTSLYPPNPVTSLQLFDSNGTLLHLNIDYHVSGSVITTTNSFPASSLIAWYRYTGAAPPVGPAPTVTSVSPNSGSTAGGTAVTVTGTNFSTGAVVRFGGVLATNVFVNSSTSINCTTPAGTAGAVTVMATVNTQSGSLTNAFTYIAPAPTVTGVSPNSGSTAGGTSVTISGTNFASGATVTFGGTTAASVVVVNATTITATTPARAAGAVTVAVTVAGQTGNLANAFTYVTPVGVTSISPTSGSTAGGTAVTITGSNFSAGATVTFGTTAATNVVVVNSTTITATTPIHAAGAVNVTVTIGGQSGTLTNGFTYVAPPTVSSVSPTTGSTAGGTAITITGTGFAVGATVTVGGVAATNVVVVNATTITATTAAHAAGTVTVGVTVSGLTGNLVNGFTYQAAAPTVQGVYGGVGQQGATSSVTLLTNTTAQLSTGDIINQLQTADDAPGNVFTFTGLVDQCIYLLLTNASRSFIDANTGFPFVFDAPIAVSIGGMTMYLYASSNPLYGSWRPQIVGSVQPPTVQAGIYGGVGAQGATSSVTVSGDGLTATLSTGDVLNELQTTAEATGQTFGPFNTTDQCVYLLLTGSTHTFADANTGFPFAFDPPIAVDVGGGVTLYLYASSNPLYGAWRPRIQT